jgi:hypothetical protein
VAPGNEVVVTSLHEGRILGESVPGMDGWHPVVTAAITGGMFR